MAIKQIYISHSSKQTKKLGAVLGKSLQSRVLICLSGDLGGGKTAFSQGVAVGLGVTENITSPTFVLLKKYKIPAKSEAKIKNLYHIDCYRLEKPEEILAIGWEEILADDTGVILVEWAERIGKYLPKKRIDIEFEFVEKNKRKIIVSN
ncbi:MAG: tRNA (adenosine(37)-N6)-threonylcarbamoyltransferase complex ATPase subunit type 1 TsaE [bacterium]|nr:tRNA (adenosine(37)-N6)-threonylcarbamoyltransferase complex ATPase subunit type 1 TsaE [bacterium]